MTKWENSPPPDIHQFTRGRTDLSSGKFRTWSTGVLARLLTQSPPLDRGPTVKSARCGPTMSMLSSVFIGMYNGRPVSTSWKLIF